MPREPLETKLKRGLEPFQRARGRSASATRLALNGRSQWNAIVAAPVSDGSDLRRNGELRFIEALHGRMRVFIDVGADIGGWTEGVPEHHRHSAGFCFEPAQSTLSALSPRTLSRTKASIAPKAVSDREGAMEFRNLSDAAPIPGVADFVVGPCGRSAPAVVTGVTLDREIERLGVDDVDLLKINERGRTCPASDRRDALPAEDPCCAGRVRRRLDPCGRDAASSDRVAGTPRLSSALALCQRPERAGSRNARRVLCILQLRAREARRRANAETSTIGTRRALGRPTAPAAEVPPSLEGPCSAER